MAGAAGVRQLRREQLLGAEEPQRQQPPLPILAELGLERAVPTTLRGTASLPEDPKYRIQRRQNRRGWRKGTKGEGGANMGRDIPFPWL